MVEAANAYMSVRRCFDDPYPQQRRRRKIEALLPLLTEQMVDLGILLGAPKMRKIYPMNRQLDRLFHHLPRALRSVPLETRSQDVMSFDDPTPRIGEGVDIESAPDLVALLHVIESTALHGTASETAYLPASA